MRLGEEYILEILAIIRLKTVNHPATSENTEGHVIESNHFVICFVWLLDVVIGKNLNYKYLH
jgi:hypothetical protein